MGIEQVKRLSVSDQVYDQLRRQIARGEWKPGDRLPSENELAAGLGVSRITVRQAIQKLVTQGLLETRFGEGTFVKVYTPGSIMQGILPAAFLGESSLLEILEFRHIIEVPTAGLAAQKAGDKDIESLEAIYNRMLEVRELKREFFRSDLDFHLELAVITRNTLAIETYSILREILEVAMEWIVDIRGDAQGIHYHRLLLEAMRAHDSVLCRRIMDEHISDTYDSIAEILKKSY